MKVQLRLSSTAAAIGLAAIALLLLLGSGHDTAQADHGQVAAWPAIDKVYLDANQSGNVITAGLPGTGTLGNIDTCIASPGNSQLVNIDIAIDRVPTIPDTTGGSGSLYGLSVYQFVIRYDITQLTLANPGNTGIVLAANTGSALTGNPTIVSTVGNVRTTFLPKSDTASGVGNEAVQEDNIHGPGLILPFTTAAAGSGTAQVELLATSGAFATVITGGTGLDAQDAVIGSFGVPVNIVFGPGAVCPLATDTTLPVASLVTVGPTPTGGATQVTLTATCDDPNPPNNRNIIAAKYYTDTDPGTGSDATGVSMNAVDGAFDETNEQVTATISTGPFAVPSSHTFYVACKDDNVPVPASPGWGLTVASNTLSVTGVAGEAVHAYITVNPGVLFQAVAGKNVCFAPVSLDGTTQFRVSKPQPNASCPTTETGPVVDSGVYTPWVAGDRRGNGLGWNVSIVSVGGAFNCVDTPSGAGATIPIATTGGTGNGGLFKIQILQADVAAQAGNTSPVPTTTVATYSPLSTTALKILSAAVNEGAGDFNYTPSFQLEVPASTVACVRYDALMSTTIASGP